jgi:hypothetical protein
MIISGQMEFSNAAAINRINLFYIKNNIDLFERVKKLIPEKEGNPNCLN